MDVTTTTYKKPDIAVTAMNDAFGQDKINTVFRSLYDQMTSYKPDTTINDFADFCFQGSIKCGYSGKVTKPAQEVPLVGLTNNGYTLNVGYITTDGNVVFFDLDTIKKSALCYDMAWQKVDINVVQAADFGDCTFQINGDGPTLLCNCLFKPCVWDNLCPQTLEEVPYCYDYNYFYCDCPWVWNDGSRPNNIMGWYLVGQNCCYISEDCYCAACLTCTCCECTMCANETCTGPDGTIWQICNTICKWCVYETWSIVPTGKTDGVCWLDPDICKFMMRPALWSWNGSNNYGDIMTNTFCSDLNVEYSNLCPGHNPNFQTNLNYCCELTPMGWEPNTCWICMDYAQQTMQRHWKSGRIDCDGTVNWNPNYEYWDKCLGFCFDARRPYNNVYDETKAYWKSPSRSLAEEFPEVEFNEGISAIPYCKEIYDKMYCCWQACGCDETYHMWIGGNYIDYGLIWVNRVFDNQRFGWRLDCPAQTNSIKDCMNFFPLGAKNGVCETYEPHYTDYTSLYYQYGTYMPTWIAPDYVVGKKWCVPSIAVDDYNQICAHYVCQTLDLIQGTYTCLAPMQYWATACQDSTCGPGNPNYSNTDLLKSNEYINVPVFPIPGKEEYVWLKNEPICNYNPWWGYKMGNDEIFCRIGTMPVVEKWWNKWQSWVYSPFNYCRLTTQYCVHREMNGTNVISLGDCVTIRVRYKKA